MSPLPPSDPFRKLRSKQHRPTTLEEFTRHDDGPPPLDEHPALRIAGLDPTDPYDRGKLHRISTHESNGLSTSGPRSAAARAAKTLLDRYQPVEMPNRPSPLTRLSEYPGDRIVQSSIKPRKLDPAEVALLTLLGSRRDDLTDDEARSVHALGRYAKTGSSDRRLVDYVLQPSVAKEKAAVARSQADYAQAQLDALPKTLPALSEDMLSELAADLVPAILEAVPELTEGEAKGRASALLGEFRAEAEAKLQKRRGEITQELAELDGTIGELTPEAAPPAPAPTQASEPLPPIKPRPLVFPNGTTMPGELLDDLIAYAGGDLSREQATVFEAKYQAATGTSIAADPMTPVHLPDGKWIPLGWGDEYIAARKGELSSERTEAVLSKVNAHLAEQDGSSLGGDAA